jgi:hypothetical protein
MQMGVNPTLHEQEDDKSKNHPQKRRQRLTHKTFLRKPAG